MSSFTSFFHRWTFVVSLLSVYLLVGCSAPKSNPVEDKAKADMPKADIPEMILTRFGAIYPKAEGPEWKNGQNGTFEVGFTQDHQECIVTFLPNGMVQQTEVKTDVASLPAAATSFISESLGVKKIDAASKIVDGFGTLTWKAEINDAYYLFTSGGQLIGKMDEASRTQTPQ